MKKDLEKLVAQAKQGDKDALESIILSIKDLVYNLSLKMLLFPVDAQDATQEILVKVITHLSTFKGESQFTTWVYRVATNYLLTEKNKKSKAQILTFEEYAKQIDTGQSNEVRFTHNEGELLLLEEEVKVSCTHGLLLCLNQKSRVVYILGELLGLNSLEGAAILEMTAENFRKHLSRSRTKIRNFLEKKCGLANPNNPCRCKKKIDFLIDGKMIDPAELRFAKASNRSIELVEKIDELEKATMIYRSTPAFKTPEMVVREMKKMIEMI